MTEQEMMDRTRALANEVIDLIASDEEFREAMKANPEGAMEQWGLAAKVDDLGEELGAEAEVQGFGFNGISPRIGLPDLRTSTIVASGAPTNGWTCSCNAASGYSVSGSGG